MKKLFYFLSVGLILLFAIGTLSYQFKNSPSLNNDYQECQEDASVHARESVINSVNEGKPRPHKENYKAGSDDRSEYLEHMVTCSDLKAQWAMADVTHKAMWVGIFGLIAVLISLFFSTIATHAARQAVSGNRAWMAYETIRFEWSNDYEIDGKKERRLIVDIILKNLGNTPAIECMSDISYMLGVAGQPASASMKSMKIDKSQTPMFTAQGKHIILSSKLSEQEGLLLTGGHKCLLFHSCCEYKTTFDNETRTTRFWGQVWFNGDRAIEGEEDFVDLKYEVGPFGKANINT